MDGIYYRPHSCVFHQEEMQIDCDQINRPSSQSSHGISDNFCRWISQIDSDADHYDILYSRKAIVRIAAQTSPVQLV